MSKEKIKEEENLEVESESEKTDKRRVFNVQPLRPINDIVDDLHKPIHSKFIKSRKQGGTSINYIAWYDASKFLDLYCPGWTYEIRNIQQFGNNIVITSRITIFAEEGEFYRESTGNESIDKSGYGDPFSNSLSMSLRRCAALWGLGQHLYRDK